MATAFIELAALANDDLISLLGELAKHLHLLVLGDILLVSGLDSLVRPFAFTMPSYVNWLKASSVIRPGRIIATLLSHSDAPLSVFQPRSGVGARKLPLSAGLRSRRINTLQ